MADKKLNEVTTVNSGTLANVKNFLAVMKDGSIQQMSKEDMASVVGGLLPIVNKTSNGLVDKNTGFYKQEDYNENLDDAANGYIRHVGDIENTHAPVDDFVGIVYTVVVANLIKVQHASNSRDSSVYERIYWERWKPWVKLS